MKNIDSIDILSLHSDSAVRVSLTFQVFRPDGSYSYLDTQLLEMVPGDVVRISVPKDFLL